MTPSEFILDMRTVCRTCLQDGDGSHMVSLYECDDLCQKIENFSGIKITRTEDLPSRICLKCRAFLILSHKFRLICQRSNEFLREYVCKESQVQQQTVESYEQLEVEVLEEGIWSNEDVIEEESPAQTLIVVNVEAAPAAPAEGKLHVCELCGNSYPRKSTLDTHMRRHRNERPYECEICHKAFHVNYQLVRHIRQHTGERPYSCQYCQRSFTDRTSQVKHERTHRNERPYACETCGKTFTYASVLKVHYKTHTGEKPHICRLCQKSFARHHNLVAHLQTQQHQNDPQTANYLLSLKAGAALPTPLKDVELC